MLNLPIVAAASHDLAFFFADNDGEASIVLARRPSVPRSPLTELGMSLGAAMALRADCERSRDFALAAKWTREIAKIEKKIARLSK